MREDTGDLWSYEAEYRVVTTNNVVTPNGLVMGAGVALQAKRRFPELPLKLAKAVSKFGNVPILCKQEGIITLPTKRHWRDPSDIDLIVQSVKALVVLVDDNKIASVVMTRPGCGNGWLTWKDVKPQIEGVLDDRFTVLGGE